MFHSLTRLAFLLGLLVLINSHVAAQAVAINDIKPGSVLFYNKYTSNPAAPQQGDTQINITNTNASAGLAGSINVHLFLVDGSSCTVADSFIHLTPNQTASFLMSDYDPGVAGYIVAVATGGGGPTQFNWLIGDAYIRETDGRVANLNAVAVAKLTPGGVNPDPNTGLLQMNFNGAEYDRLPGVVAVSSFNSQTTDSTQVNLYSPAPDLTFGATPTAVRLFTLVYDDAENVFSTTVNVTCYSTFYLGSMRVTGGNINVIVPAGRTGWMRFNGSGRPLMGAVLHKGPVFNGGHNLHVLSTLSSYAITVPSF